MTTATKSMTAGVRHTDLRRLLQDHRREVQNDVQGRIQEVRRDGPAPVLDAGEFSADLQDDIELSLIQMRALIERLAFVDLLLLEVVDGDE